MCIKCVSPEMAILIEEAEDPELPDGAYFARCEEMGITVEDLEAYYDKHEGESKKPPDVR